MLFFFFFFFSHTSKNRSNLIKKKQSKKILRGEFDLISVHLKTYHCIHFVDLQACKWSRSKTLWFLDSDAVENNKHRTLSVPISVGFKRTPYYKPCKPPGQTLFVYVGLPYKCIKHRLRKIFNLGEGGSSNCKRSK